MFFHKGEIADFARDLRKKLREVKFDEKYEGLSKFAKEFKNYPQCYNILGAMVKMRCSKTCRNGGGLPFCKIRSAVRTKECGVAGNVANLRPEKRWIY